MEKDLKFNHIQDIIDALPAAHNTAEVREQMNIAFYRGAQLYKDNPVGFEAHQIASISAAIDDGFYDDIY